MSNQQLSLFSDSNCKIRIEWDEVGWRWYIMKPGSTTQSGDVYHSAADAEQDLITFLKNYEGFRNG